jgi:protein-tyrosine phosphatase
MINEFIAVGDCESSYEEFDIIVNLFLEDNGCELNQIILVIDNGKKIYNVGLIDKPEYKDEALYLLSSIIPELVNEKNKKILFHCYAGVSRSATFAIAYLMITNNLSVNDAYNIIKLKRNCIQPNDGFMQTLNDFNKIIGNNITK